MQTEKLYEVVGPLGKSAPKKITPAHPLSQLHGKRIALIWTIFSNGDLLADTLMDLLHNRFKDIETVKLPAGKNAKWGDYPDESIEDVVKEAGVDAAVITVGC
jgi:hypothetical protein